ncbi:uncharacterized protein LOC113353390 [Papaver somniferum]|uniref:uncharacterized protein LOC113353390 n=1 Tax=Papaver somniferum TaxID=3469 RepID=UPI000E6FAB30|nr:uncharacterized protein LOC113353390 [Papaver somniferum]
MVKSIDVDPNTKVDVFLCTVRDIFGIPEAVPISMKYHIFFSPETSKLVDVTPAYESLKFIIQPGLMLHHFYVEENVVEDDIDTYSNAPRCSRSAGYSGAVQSPPTGVEIPVKPSAHVHVGGSSSHAQSSSQALVLNPIPTRKSNKRSVMDRDDPVNAVTVGGHVGRTSSTNSSHVNDLMRICITSLCGKEKPLDIERTDTIGSIKERIRKIEGTAVKDQILAYKGIIIRQQQDHLTVAYLGIHEGSTIDILQCMKGC